MDQSQADDRPTAAEADLDALLRMRIAMANAAFVAEGVTLGLLLKWAERARPFDDLPPLRPPQRASKDSALWSGSSTERS